MDDSMADDSVFDVDGSSDFEPEPAPVRKILCMKKREYEKIGLC